MCLLYHGHMSTLTSSIVINGPAWPGVRILVSTRSGGVSQPPFDSMNLGDHVGDAALAVEANRARLDAMLPAAPCWLRQIHGTDVHDADTGEPQHAADAAVTREPCRVLAILTADCLPVVIADQAGRALGVAHAGWRGLAAGVLERTVDAVRHRAGGQGLLHAWIGPAIGPTAFEVGADVLQAFGGITGPAAQAFAARPGIAGKWWCNLPKLAEQRMRAAGVSAIEHSGLCTASDVRFYSYRKQGSTGRFATLAWLTGEPIVLEGPA